jgi:hypothetical protein
VFARGRRHCWQHGLQGLAYTHHVVVTNHYNNSNSTTQLLQRGHCTCVCAHRFSRTPCCPLRCRARPTAQVLKLQKAKASK